MGGAAVKGGKPRTVELVVSEIGGVPGCKAYHSSIVLQGVEYSFSDLGISSHLDLASHEGRAVHRMNMGSTSETGFAMEDRLMSHFKTDSYDLLRKNCNSFSDAALCYLVGKRLDKKYRQLEQMGARCPQLVTALSRGEYSPNPAADGFDLERLCTDLRFGPAWANQGGGQTLDGGRADASAPSAACSPGTSAARAKKSLPALVRVLILPFKDTFEFNFDHMCQKYVLPHVRSPAISDPETGVGLRAGDEFSAEGGRVRFRVISCEPPQGGLPNGMTAVLCEGEPIERVLLKSVTILPLESAMPQLKGKKPADLASEYVRPFLEQRSADLVPGQIHAIQGARFKVVQTSPDTGGGACLDTELCTTGGPVKLCTVEGCDGAIAKQCREKSCKRWVCMSHAAEVKETSCLCPTHAPKKGFLSLLRGS